MGREPVEIVSEFWDALYERDWPAVRSFFDEDSIYYDVPTGPTTAAKGPEAIEARLRLGLEGLAGYDHERGFMASDGDHVFTEHAETWRWASGESVRLPFLSVQRVANERITLWKDYWDYETLMRGSPADWQERLATADLWWLFDATGIA